MIKTLNILFYVRREKPHTDGTLPLYCRITLAGKRSVFALHRNVHPDKWDAAKCRVKGNTEEAISINALLNRVRTQAYETVDKLAQSNKSITAESIKNQLTGKTQPTSRSLFTVFEEHNAKMKTLIGTDCAKGTYVRYETCLKHLREFVKTKYKLSNYNLTDVNDEFVYELDYFFRYNKQCCNNTTLKYIKNFKKIILIALANRWITLDPFLNYKVKFTKTDRGYLTQEELDALMQKTFSVKRLEQVRDVFIFQCYTGLAHCDTLKLTKENLSLEVENNTYWLKTRRTKTDTAVNVPLLPKAIEILAKYKDHSEESSNGLILPVLTNQRMNGYLKEVSDLCEITKRLTCHLARHTFATTVTLSNGVSVESVSKMLGHSSIITTKIYARILDSRVSSEMSELSKKLLMK